MNTAQSLLLSFGAPILLGVALLGYVAMRAKSAKLQVGDFCASVELGAPSDGLAERARGIGLSVHEFPPKEGKSTLLVEDGVLLARHVCTLDFEQGKLVHKDNSFID